MRHGTDRIAGVVTIGALLVALVLANSPVRGLYEVLHHLPLTVEAGEFGISKPLILWVNDGLMVFFFLLVALEMKREAVDGHLASRSALTGPLLGALGGAVVPAMIYLALNGTAGPGARGWPVPVATDIVLALTVLAVLGDRVPPALKVFVTALAVFDDLFAILIVAVYYTASLSVPALAIGFLAAFALVLLNAVKARHAAAYGVAGLVLWLALTRAGIHGTVAGVAVGLAVPFRSEAVPVGGSPLERLERGLYPWVAFGVVPVFAFFNAGIELSGESVRSLVMAPSMGIIFGLVVGKPVGVLTGVGLAVASGLTGLPRGTHWCHLIGAALATGVGFTMSLFLAGLAFADPTLFLEARLSVIVASSLSALASVGVFLSACPRVESERQAHMVARSEPGHA